MKLVSIFTIPVTLTLVLSGCSVSKNEIEEPEPIQTYTNQQDGFGNTDSSGQNDWSQTDDSAEPIYEQPFDADGDGIPDYADIDAAGDGFISGPPSGEMNTPFDADGDGIPNSADWDKDGDGFAD